MRKNDKNIKITKETFLKKYYYDANDVWVYWVLTAVVAKYLGGSFGFDRTAPVSQKMYDFFRSDKVRTALMNTEMVCTLGQRP